MGKWIFSARSLYFSLFLSRARSLSPSLPVPVSQFYELDSRGHGPPCPIKSNGNTSSD